MIGSFLALFLLPQQDASDEAERPVHVEVHRDASRTRVLVIGDAGRPMNVRYELTLENGGNRTAQSGSERLDANRRVVLADVVQSGAGVRGQLRVSSGPLAYVEDIPATSNGSR